MGLAVHRVATVSWTGDDIHDEWSFDHPQPDLTETDNPVAGRLLGPKGETIRQWRERPIVEFGFQRPRKARR